MLRNIVVSFPALALALPFVVSQPAQAQPLTAEVETAEFVPTLPGKQPGKKPGKQPGKKPGKKPGKEVDVGGDASLELALEFCTKVQILAESRACEVRTGEACFAACDDFTVAPSCDASEDEACIEDTVRACLDSCEADGAAFCDERYIPGKKPTLPGKKPGKKPTLPGKKPTRPGTKPDTSDEEGGGLIFVNVENCVALGLDIDLKN